MKVIVIYESFFCNTEQIAKAISEGFESYDEVEVCKVGDVKPEQLKRFDLLVVWGPLLVRFALLRALAAY
jgi:flavodoxin